MNPTQLDERLRQLDPATGLDRDPTSSEALRLLSRVHTGNATSRRPRPRRTRTVVALAAAFTVASTAAVATGVFQPDPADVDTILEDAVDRADVHLPGWRPSLRAETVWCYYAPDQSIDTPVSEFPLDQPLTRDRIAKECTSGNDMVRTMAAPPDQVTLCAAAIAPQDYQQRLAEREEPVLAGDPSKAQPVFTVALGWDTTCEEAQLHSTPPVGLTPLTDDHLDRVNEVREVEVSLRAMAMERCISREEARATADQVRDQLHGEWPLISLPDRPIGGTDCHQVWIDEWGLLSLQGR